MRPGHGWWVVHEASRRPDHDGLVVHRGTVLVGDRVKVEARPTEEGWERRGTTFWGDDVVDALRQATLVGAIGRAPSEAGPDVGDADHVEVSYGDSVAERALRGRVAAAYEIPGALGIRNCDMHLVTEVMASGVDLSIRPSSLDPDELWPDETGDDAPSP